MARIFVLARGPVRRLALVAGVLATSLGALVAAAAAKPAKPPPPQPVTCGSTITAPGQYFLEGDCTGPGISIEASNVHLKLNGYTMTAGGSAIVGIVARGVAGLHIQGPGAVTGYSGGGIAFFAVNDSHVQKVTLSEDEGVGGLFSNGSRDQFNQNLATSNSTLGGFAIGGANNGIVNNTAEHNVIGIDILPDSTNDHLNSNQASDNSITGILLRLSATANQVHGNTAFGNVIDLEDDNFDPPCDDNNWSGNRFVIANQPLCIH